MKALIKNEGSVRFHIPSLDGIRAFAFLIVFLSHLSLTNETIVPGHFGVTIFFFLSGYLITTLLRREYERFENLDFKGFYLRRILRIWPPLYLVLFLVGSLTILGVLKEKIELLAFLSQVLHFSNYYMVSFGSAGIMDGTGVVWSLAVEEHFYLIFPLLYFAFLKLRISSKNQVLILYGLCLAILIWRCILVYHFSASTPRTFLATDTRADSILFGCILALNGNPMLDEPSSDRLLKQFFVPLGIVLLLFCFIYRSPSFRETFRYSLQGIGLYPLFIAAIRFPNWGLFQWLNVSWISFTGKLSYSLYLIHGTVIHAVFMYLPKFHLFIQGVLSLLISFGLAYIIYKFIELPIGKLRKKLSHV